MEKKIICVGIDQSYEDTGITINYDNGKKIKAYHIKFDKKTYKSKTEIRKKLSKEVSDAIIKYKNKHNIVIVVERIRQFSGGFLSMNYIKSIAGLITSIVDVAYENNVEVFSVDTRNWKKQIIGTTKPMKNKEKINPKKYPTILWCINNGYKDFIYDKNTNKYNDNIADSIAISFSYFNNNCKK